MSWPSTWEARWIWVERPASDPSSTRNRFAYLRRSFVIDDVPETAPCRVTADSRFVLFVNGQEVARGPARSIPARLAWADVDLAPLLVTGDNALAVLVRFYGQPAPWWLPATPSGHLGHGGFALEAPDVGLLTDGSWRARWAPYAQDVPTPRHGVAEEHVDGGAWPRGWSEAGYDDSGWAPAVELRGGGPSVHRTTLPLDPYAAMEPAGIAPLTALAVDLAVVAGASGVYDAGGIILATPWLDVRGPAGAAIDVVVGEDLSDKGEVVTAPRNYRLRYTLGGGDAEQERVEGFDVVGFHYLGVEAEEGVEVVVAGAVERRYPRAAGASFTSADHRLSRLWEVGARTLEVCSTDAFLDCPGREQRAWLGDAYVHALLTMVTSTDWRLVRRHLRIGAHSRRPDGLLPMVAAGDLALAPVTIPDYSLHWVRTLARYTERSGDLDTAGELMSTALDIVDAFERHRADDGLLHRVPGWVFVDWATTERADVVGALDALLAAALDDLSSVAALIGHGATAVSAGERATRSRAALEALWDEERGVYVDAADGGGPRRRVSQQTNALAIVSGAASPDRAARILAAILDRNRLVRTTTTADMPPGRELASQYGPPDALAPFDEEVNVVAAQPFFRHFVHDAVATAGRRDLLPGLCLDWWPQVEGGATTFGEYWEAAPGRASRAHAWSATPTWDLTTHVLGVRLLSVGCGKVLVDPLPDVGPLAGCVPLPQGLLEVECDGSAVRVQAPDGVEVEVGPTWA